MNAFVKKEIRLLLPGWLAVLLLEAVQPWIWREPSTTFGVAPVIFFFGMIILAIDSFGREFSSRTFQSLLSQPIERRQIWRTKITILFFGAVLISAAYFASCELRLHEGFKILIWQLNPNIIKNDFRDAMISSGAVLFVALTGGLWTALLFRQIATSFWITFLAPAGLAMAIIFFMPDKAGDTAVAIVFEIAAAIYSLSGFLLARKLFYRAQDAAWTGGVISFSRWRYFESGAEVSVARWRRPIRALFRKEFQLHSIALLGGGILLGLHIVVFFLRAFYANSHKNSMIAVISDFFWVLWLVMPLVIGCMAVAEERKLGVADEQFCLPVSRRIQFLIKLVPTMFFGILIGGVMPLLLEGIAKYLGDGNAIFTSSSQVGQYVFGDGLPWLEINITTLSVVALSAGFALAAFFGSTLAKNFLQALSITIIAIVGSIIFVGFIGWVNRTQPTIFGITPWHSILPVLIALLVVPTMLIWLAYLNFNHFQESKRLWRRNVLGISGALLLVIVSSAAIYNRAWEMFEPAEPPHGAAKLSLQNPPKINARGGITILIPDGRAWLDYAGLDFNFSGRFKDMVRLMLNPLPQNEGPAQFIQGSNWVQVVTDLGRTIGIKSDGTLWISPKIFPRIPNIPTVELTNATSDTDWQTMDKRGYYSGPIFLLKTNHTLWEWRAMLSPYQKKSESPPPSLPIRIGTNSDWAETFLIENSLRKTDGTVWQIDWEGKTNKIVFDRVTNFDDVNFQTFSYAEDTEETAYVGKDGRLKIYNWNWAIKNRWTNPMFLPCDNETNWVSVSVHQNRMVALKSDGTLWQWKWKSPQTISDTIHMQPARLGIHNDWVAMSGTRWSTITLAADGSVWLWFDPESFYGETLMKSPKQPEFLGNVFDNEK